MPYMKLTTVRMILKRQHNIYISVIQSSLTGQILSKATNFKVLLLLLFCPVTASYDSLNMPLRSQIRQHVSFTENLKALRTHCMLVDWLVNLASQFSSPEQAKTKVDEIMYDKSQLVTKPIETRNKQVFEFADETVWNVFASRSQVPLSQLSDLNFPVFMFHTLYLS